MKLCKRNSAKISMTLRALGHGLPKRSGRFLTKPPSKSCNGMARYSVQILPSVISKDLVKLPRVDVQRIMERIHQLADNPKPTWSKKLSGREKYRAGQGNYPSQ